MQWMLMPLRRYAEFGGRSRRLEYWMFMLGYAIFFALWVTLMVAVAGDPADKSGSASMEVLVVSIGSIVLLATLVPGIALQVRRFHDQDKSGWFILLNLIPYVGGFIVLVLMCMPGTQGENEYGPDPLDSDGHLTKVFG